MILDLYSTKYECEWSKEKNQRQPFMMMATTYNHLIDL